MCKQRIESLETVMMDLTKLRKRLVANLMSHSTENSLESPHLGASKRIAKNRGVLSSLVCHDYMWQSWVEIVLDALLPLG